jgi:hypothetical protein
MVGNESIMAFMYVVARSSSSSKERGLADIFCVKANVFFISTSHSLPFFLGSVISFSTILLKFE